MNDAATMTNRSDSTSAFGAMRPAPQTAQVVLIGLLAFAGTTANLPEPTIPPLNVQRATERTTSGSTLLPALSPGSAIGELRRLSGLTWDQLARVLGVSRRSMHFWASGKAMAPANHEHLQRVLGVVRQLDQGSATRNRAALLETGSDGIPAMDLLATKQYPKAASRLGSGDPVRHRSPKLSAEAIAARRPRPPQELVGALQHTIHRDIGPARVVKTVRRPVDR